MSHISKLKLSTQALSQPGKMTPKEALRARAVNHLAQQRALVEGQLSGTPYLPYKTVTRKDPAGNRIRVQEPVHVRRNWFEDAKGVVYFSIRYGAKALPFDKTGNCSIEVGTLQALPGIIDTLTDVIRAGELDTQLAAAAAERKKVFKRRPTKPAAQAS
jgi:hypothetical protein